MTQPTSFTLSTTGSAVPTRARATSRTPIHLAATLGLLGAVLAPGAAQAQGVGEAPYSTDIEFIRPTFGHGSFVGVDVPMANKPMTFRYGLVAQYERDPLTLYNRLDDTEQGAIVANRGNAIFGASMDFSDRFSAHVALPVAFNWGTEIQNLSADGFGAGDFSAGARVIAYRSNRDVFNVGARAAIVLPTGRQNSYIGENSVRGNAGLVAAANLGALRLATDAGVVIRTGVTTAEDFVLDDEITWGGAARYALPDATRMAFTAQVLGRAGLKNFMKGGAENSLEALGGVQIMPSRNVTLDIAAGRGLTEGYGTTDFRALAALVIQHVPKDPPPPPPPEEWAPPPPPPPPPPPIEDEPEPEWEPEQLVKVVAERIVIKDMLEFRVNTNILLEKSKPTLREVARIINENANIGHVVIEGHASQEGDYKHNYELSESRARAVFEFLFEQGVHPSRLSYRAFGEVQPIVQGEDEESLQANRRVEFHIVRQYDSPEEMPTYDEKLLLPWNGAEVKIVQPPKPEPPKPVETGPKLDEFGLPVDTSEDFEIDMGEPEGGGAE